MSYRNTFHKNFYKTCMPLLAQFEQERKELHKKCTIRAVIGIILSIVSFTLLTYFDIVKPNLDNFLKISIIIMSIVTLKDFYWQKSFEQKIKFKIMPVFCKALGDFRWQSEKTINYDIFVKAGVVLQNWYKAKSDDIFIGKHKNVSIEIAEVRYYKKEIQEDKITFKGVCVVLDINKRFNGHTLVTSDTGLHISPIYGLKHTLLEDVKFEKMFDVFTEDEVEARYLLTPSFMERLVNVKRTFNAAKISCAFYMNKLFISIDTGKDMFSLGNLTVSTDNYRQFYQMFEEVTSIIELIDQLKLDQKIGL